MPAGTPKPFTILVTGGAGYIGSHAVLALLDAGWPVAVLDNLSTGFRWAADARAAFYEGDIDDQAHIRFDQAVFRPSIGFWYQLNSTTGFQAIRWGLNGDIPVLGDYDGDGKADPAVFRPSDRIWYILTSRDNSYKLSYFGLTTDIPIPSAYVR